MTATAAEPMGTPGTPPADPGSAPWAPPPPAALETHLAAPATLGAFGVNTGGAGLVLGVDQHGGPVAVRLFRPEPTRAVFVGGLRFAQLLAFRALALRVQVVVETGRPAAWGTFARVTTVPDTVRLVPPGTPPQRTGSRSRPRLVILDTGASANDAQARHGGGWTAVVALREDLTAWDVDPLVRAELVALQPLSPVEAALVNSALNLGVTEQALSQLRPDMVTLVSHGTVRWVRIVPTAVERQFVGVPSRY